MWIDSAVVYRECERLVPDGSVSHHDLPPSAHVLIVEDDAGMRLLLARFLTANGLRATACAFRSILITDSVRS